MGGKKPSGAAKRKKKKRKKEAIERAREEMERLKLGPSKLWTGLVMHYKDIFVSHVLPKLNDTDRYFFSKANTESWDLLEYAGVNVFKQGWSVDKCSSISTLELAWNNMNWGKKCEKGQMRDQAWFCKEVAGTNKLEFLKWARGVKKCEWNERTINVAARIGNLGMLKYCFANDCPCDEKQSCCNAAATGYLDCLRFLFDKLKPSRKVERDATMEAAACGQLDILKYCIEEKKITDRLEGCLMCAAGEGKLACLKYLVDEAKAPLNDFQLVSAARYKQQLECENYLLEKGAAEPTDQECEDFIHSMA
jgi:hypothetical protein